MQSFQAPHMRIFSRQLTAFVQSAEQAGTVTLEATAKGVKAGKITIEVK